MQKVFFTPSQTQDLNLALWTHFYYLLDEVERIKCGQESIELDIMLDKGVLGAPKDDLDLAIMRREAISALSNKLARELRIIVQLIPCQEFIDLTTEQVELMHEAVYYYLWTALSAVIRSMESNPGCDESLFLFFPQLENDFVAENVYPEFLDNRENVDFFEKLLERGNELQYYLRGYFPNNLVKSESEHEEFLLDAKILRSLDDASAEIFMRNHPIYSQVLK